MPGRRVVPGIFVAFPRPGATGRWSPDARIHHPPVAAGHPRDADGGLRRLPSVPVRRRPGEPDARPGCDARGPGAAARRSRPRQALLLPVRPLHRQRGAGGLRPQPAPGSERLVADQGAPAGHARTVVHRGADRAGRRHPDGRLHGAPTQLLVRPVPARRLARRHFAADLPDRHPADPRVRRAARMAPVLRSRRGRAARLVVDRIADRAPAGST